MKHAQVVNHPSAQTLPWKVHNNNSEMKPNKKSPCYGKGVLVDNEFERRKLNVQIISCPENKILLWYTWKRTNWVVIIHQQTNFFLQHLCIHSIMITMAISNFWTIDRKVTWRAMSAMNLMVSAVYFLTVSKIFNNECRSEFMLAFQTLGSLPVI